MFRYIENVFFRFNRPYYFFIAFMISVQFSTASASITLKATYYHNDMLGSPIAATDMDGIVQWRKKYRPYGQTVDADDENHIG